MDEGKKCRIKWKYVLLVFGAISAAVAILALFMPPHSNYGYPVRDKVIEMIMAASFQKPAIEMALKSNSPVENVEKPALRQNQYISYIKISSTGEITAFSEELGTLVVLTPMLNSGEVTWKCLVLPVKNATSLCR